MSSVTNPHEIRVGDFVLDLRSLDLRDASGRRVPLRAKASEVLACLAARPDEIVTKTEIASAVWPDLAVTDESLTRCIADIRKAIGDRDQRLIETHIGKGYSLSPGAAARSPPAPARRRAWALGGLALALLAGLAVWLLRPAPEPDGPTRVAVLAFEDLSVGEDRGYLSDGIAEGIITELARYPELAVIARNSSFSFRGAAIDVTEIADRLRADFVVEGSVQKSADRLRVTVQLINGRDGAHQWAHEFNSELDNYFEVQSRVALGVATHLGRELAWLAPQTGGPERVSALHLYLRGNTEFKKSTPEATRTARDLYLAAIEADPEAPYGHVGMALVVWQTLPQRWLYEDMSREDLLQMGIDHADEALRLDPDYYAAHIARGDMHDRAGEPDLAIVRYQHAASLNPSSADAMALTSEPLIFLGRAEEAIRVLERAIDINPITPGWYFKSMSFAHWAAGNCAEAVAWMERRASFRPWDLRHLMVAQACAGDLDAARETVARHMAAEPDYTIRTYRERNTPAFARNPDLIERFVDDMRKAGMLEG